MDIGCIVSAIYLVVGALLSRKWFNDEYKDEYDELDDEKKGTWSVNGCIFDVESDNLVAFLWYESAFKPASKYYKVVEQEEI